jgi:hypothetical protein
MNVSLLIALGVVIAMGLAGVLIDWDKFEGKKPK